MMIYLSHIIISPVGPNRLKAIKALRPKAIRAAWLPNKPKGELVSPCRITGKVDSYSSFVFFSSTLFKSRQRPIRFHLLIIACLIHIIHAISSVILALCSDLFHDSLTLLVKLGASTFSMASLFLYRMPLFKACKPPLCPFRTLLASIFRQLALEFWGFMPKQIASCWARIRVFVISDLPLNQSSFKCWPCLFLESFWVKLMLGDSIFIKVGIKGWKNI
jgi:hypothetical protein